MPTRGTSAPLLRAHLGEHKATAGSDPEHPNAHQGVWRSGVASVGARMFSLVMPYTPFHCDALIRKKGEVWPWAPPTPLPLR